MIAEIPKDWFNKKPKKIDGAEVVNRFLQKKETFSFRVRKEFSGDVEIPHLTRYLLYMNDEKIAELFPGEWFELASFMSKFITLPQAKK